MAKFRFPGKALKLNTRKRVRFRGSHAANTPEELYTRRIRRGLDLFTQIFGESDEDEDEFEGFTSTLPEPRDATKGKKKTGSPRKKKLPAEKVEEACATLEEEGLVTRRKVSAVEMAIKEVQEKSEVNENVPVVTRRRVGAGDSTVGKEAMENAGSSKDVVSTRRRISAVEIATKEVPEGTENKDLPVVTRRRVSGVETAKEGAEKIKDPSVVTRRRGQSLEGIVKNVQEKSENLQVGGEAVSEEQELAQPVSDENIENVVNAEKSTNESDTTVHESRVVVMPTGQMARKQTARRVSRPSTVETALAKKLLARAKAKRSVNSLPVVGEKSPKRFVLPSKSVRSSRIIKPNKRLFADITEMCTASSSLQTVGEEAELESIPNKRLVKLTRKGRSSHTQFLSLPRSRAQSTDSLSSSEGGGGRDRMRRTISLYTESITGPSKAQVGRPPKRLIRRMDPPPQEIEAEVPDSPQRCDRKESKVMEKIGKLLRSPWDDRLKQSGKGGKGEEEGMPPSVFGATSAMSASAISRNILRKARLNLNKTTLQKIRNPVSLQRLVPASDEGVEGNCAVCDKEEGNSRKFGVVLCEKCSSFISNSSDGSREVYECEDKAECEVQVEEGRCNACWLGRILHVCTMPNLLHDRLRKRLPSILKEQIPTSLARSMSGGSVPSTSEKDGELATHTKRLPLDPGGGGAFGSVMDLPGGWKRKTGPEVIVISPSGEKFKSMQKLEEFLKKQGITTDARVLFGNSSPAVVRSNEAKSRSSAATNSSRGKVVMTTLPGGWVRRIKWRSAGDRFDTYVYSPDGRTFRSRRELSAYFQLIGKVDDIHKYFPVVTGHSDASIPSSSDTTGSSSTERLSSSEPCSEISSDDKSPEASECEAEPSHSRGRKLSRSGKEKLKVSRIKASKVKNHKEGHLRSKSVSSLKNIETIKKEEVQMKVDQSADAKVIEKKYKKPKITVRSRSLSLGRKKADASLTDTTESESENKMSGKGFAKSFSKRIKNKPKSALRGSITDLRANNSNENTGKTILAEPCEGTEGNEVRKPEAADEKAHVFIKPNDVSMDKQSDQRKIVLKIQKKNIEPIDRRHRHRNKEDKRKKTSCFEVSGSLSDEQVAQSGAESVQNRTAEKALAQLSSTSKSSDDARDKVSSNSSDDLDRDLIDGESDIPAGPDVSDDSKFSSPMVSESEPINDTIEVPEAKPKSKPKKPSNYQTSHFGGGWSRKIKWNEKGEGKIALLHSPDGQTFRSRIELLAYFKKAGKSKGNLDFYFPPVLTKEDYYIDPKQKSSVTEVATPLATSTSGQSSEVSEFSDSELPKTSEESCVSGEEGTKRRITRIVKYRKVGGATLKSIPEGVTDDSQTPLGKGNLSEEAWKLAKTGRKELFVAIPDSKQTLKSESEEIEGTQPEAGGPRVKHVCRSQAQVLGIPRAVFPSPNKDEDKAPVKVVVPTSKADKKRKIVTVTTTASGKVLRKTQWCNKCPGCTTPNCRKCVNCLDMKKYGGPGTKKKPCVMRKCHNPRLSIKSAIHQEGTTKIPVHINTTTTLPTSKEVRKVPSAIIKVQDENTLSTETSSDLVMKSFQQERAVFVPRQMTRSQPDQKDRGDIAAGKQFVPGTLVNIDYWQGYDADEMMLTGYPVITSSSQNPQIVCFRCGSLGKEQLLYCAWCCEGVHPYCLEDGEGPESEVEEAFWICRRCAVCYVCGAPGADSLLRCSDCRNYYHMECLGPSAHSTCQPPPDRPWEAESMALLAESWPKQSAIFDAGGGEAETLLGDIVMHTELDAVKDLDEDEDEEDLEPDIFFLPVSEEAAEQQRSLFEQDSLSDDEELEDSFCLEDSIVEVFRDINLYKPEPSPTANIRGEEVTSMKKDEYLFLGYKKINEYPTNRIEVSYFRLLQIIHNELFATLGYPTWREMLRDGLVTERSCGSVSGSDTETASEGMSDEDEDESDLDWEDIFEIRRHEAAEELKEREDKRREEERRLREIEREKARIEKLKEMEREAKEKESSQCKEKDSFIPKMKILGSDKVATPQDLAKKPLFKKKRKCGRPPGSTNKLKYGDEDFVVLDGSDEEGHGELGVTPKRKRLKQPRSWEEFDELFARSGVVLDAAEEESKEGRIRKRKVIFSDNGIIGMRHDKIKLRAKRQKLGLVSSKKFKSLKGLGRGKLLKFKDKVGRKPGRPPKIKPEKRANEDDNEDEEIQSKKKKSNVNNIEISEQLKKRGRKPNGISKELPAGEVHSAVQNRSSAEEDSGERNVRDQKEPSQLESHSDQSGKKARPEEENSDKENLPGVGAADTIKESDSVISQKKHINGLDEAGTSACSQSAEGVEEGAKQGRSDASCLDVTKGNLPKLPEKRARRSVGRASELASQRKAMMDF